MPDPDDGFAELWDAHYDDVLAYAARRVDHETARDVAAETFLVAWRRRKDIPADRPFPWLLHVARNVLANEARGRRRRGRLWGRLRDDREHQRPVDDIATGLAEGGRIDAALRRLPERDREALRLVGWECLNTRDAAVVAGCSAKAFSVRLHRARRRLSAVLAELDAEDQHLPILEGSPQT
ncbi:RNA polymerase sigma-70 factor (ECF subfamily) [Actinomadura pelletieri DSM 43383]|uniref:RNA polymerase sigma-70 factor (ECF subfamily) n=1 Tax=Actinomadura pelletieri DSM 43383 TaxID=1120940 RepID=A0A495QYD6_9ACTN|nr:sigma-70 family RNA polymerase sigma factor [Actinomadura pelletieri]RKS79077.1 RNA polymerase sigma-70 factor (ECF subfamily) [Actinomadura pelletieri DSM 43383]